MVSAVARCAWKPTLSSFVAKRSILFYQADGPICWMCQVKSRYVRHSIWGCNNRIYEFMHEIYTTLKWKIYARKIINYIICRIKLICGWRYSQPSEYTKKQMIMRLSCVRCSACWMLRCVRKCCEKSMMILWMMEKVKSAFNLSASLA